MLQTCRRLHSRILAVFAVVLIGAAAAAEARANSECEALIRSMADTVLSVLRNKGMDRPTREGRIRAIYQRNFDTVTIASWVMGQPWRSATEPQRAQYLQMFETYIVKVYTGQLANYSSEQLKITGSEPDGDGCVVASLLVDPQTQRVVEVKWRLRKAGGGWKVRDIVIENISMAFNLKSEFRTVFQQRGGTVDGLVAALREKIAELERK